MILHDGGGRAREDLACLGTCQVACDVEMDADDAHSGPDTIGAEKIVLLVVGNAVTVFVTVKHVVI